MKQPPDPVRSERRGPGHHGRRPLDRLAYRRQFTARRYAIAWRMAGRPRADVRLDPPVDRPDYEPKLEDLVITHANRIIDQPPERQERLQRLYEKVNRLMEDAAAKGDRRALTSVLQHRIAMVGKDPFGKKTEPGDKGPKRS